MSHPELDEVMSPELVLVDPELARLARQRLCEAPERRPQPRPIAAFRPSRPLDAAGPAVRRRTVRAMASGFGGFATAIPMLLLGAVVVVMVASEVRAQLVDDPATLVAPAAPGTSRLPLVTTTAAPTPEVRPQRRATPPRAITRARPPSAPAKPPPASRFAPPAKAATPAPSPAPAPARRPPVSGPPPVNPAKAKQPPAAPARVAGNGLTTKSEVEARTLMMLQERVALWVPPALLDRKTGMLVNNVHVVCRRVGRASRFDCKLGVGRSQAGEWLLRVVVARDGTQTLTWRGRATAR
ncbi:MAG: hypothetical protein ACR2GT_02200 [Gaiellaceae bacterium]